MIKHQETHPRLDQPGCWACEHSSIAFSASCTPTRRPVAVEKVAMEERWNVDMPAFARLSKEGLDPQTIDGCAALETRANTEAEVKTGVLTV